MNKIRTHKTWSLHVLIDNLQEDHQAFVDYKDLMLERQKLLRLCVPVHSCTCEKCLEREKEVNEIRERKL